MLSFAMAMTPARCCCLLLLLALNFVLTTALQVTPGSPCASLCLDSATGGTGDDPGTPDIRPQDIVCSNRDFAGPEGQKFQRCMNCLQNSTYEQDSGSQNDQAWFLYNLQYAFAHCVFGYPNGTGIGSYPCMTSEACGPLKATVTGSLANNTGTDPYAYCRYKGGSTLGDTFGKCLDCMRPDTEHGYLTNYFVALEAGCEQRPGPHGRVSLNDTLFANRTIGILDPNTPHAGRSAHPGLSTGALIAVVVVGVLVGLALAGACVFLFLRRRRRRNLHNTSALEYAARNHHKRGPSSLDFRCAAHVNPFSPGFIRNGSTDRRDDPTDGPYDGGPVAARTAAAVGLYPTTTTSTTAGAGAGAAQDLAATDEKARLAAAAAVEKQQLPPYPGTVDALRSHPPAGPVRNFSHKHQHHPHPHQHQQHPSAIDTTTTTTATTNLAPPEKVMTSPTPYSPDSFTSPSSATSATPFLAPGQNSAFSPTSPRVAAYSPHASSSPLVRQQQHQQQQQSWEEVPTRAQGRGVGVGLLRSKASKTDVNAPVATRQLQTTFPPPPKR
ncbi:LPXTG-domain-containing protein [Cordyceps javanica]|uniref:LPXTG-domain-containing protein n=1 Tax=Cordyceps javanica TaxID=43265 RepID=A0A545UNP3_9HYPO|nr:LPXTG-domain-containing protein [Cordyceps javanica]TQW02821.1 LPXTG-domain-containing protein [Cordyceps javanica]